MQLLIKYLSSTSAIVAFEHHHAGNGYIWHVVVVAQCIVSITFSLGTIAAANGMHSILLQAVLRLPMTFFDVTPLGRILNRFSKDVDTCDNVLPHVLRMFIAMTFGVSFHQNFYSIFFSNEPSSVVEIFLPQIRVHSSPELSSPGAFMVMVMVLCVLADMSMGFVFIYFLVSLILWWTVTVTLALESFFCKFSSWYHKSCCSVLSNWTFDPSSTTHSWLYEPLKS